jgi:hypothetical protein
MLDLIPAKEIQNQRIEQLVRCLESQDVYCWKLVNLIFLQCIVYGNNIPFAELANASIKKMAFNSIFQQIIV